jgi:hypothetical protein
MLYRRRQGSSASGTISRVSVTDMVRKLFPLIGQWEADVDAEAKALAAPAPSSTRQ